MRRAFIRTLVDLATEDERILLMTGDLGYMAIEPFAERFPRRFFNVGVAEQNLVGLATGLSESGYIPFLYSITTFVAMRAYEFIRNGPLAHGLPVRIIGVGGGFEYGHAGVTHFGVDDIGVMRVQPAMRVIAPADHEQAASALRATWQLDGPIYYRLGKDDQNTVPGLNGRFEAGRAQRLAERAGSSWCWPPARLRVRPTKRSGMLARRGIAVGIHHRRHGEPAAGRAASSGAGGRADRDDRGSALSGRRPGIARVGNRGGARPAPAGSCGVASMRCRSAAIGSEAYMADRYGLSPSGLVESALGALA